MDQSPSKVDEWHDLMPAAELPRGAVIAVSWRDNDLLLYRTSDGECSAIAAYCPHQGNYIPNGLAPNQPLNTLLVDDEVLCPFHGWRFNSKGRCTHIPQGQRVPAPIRAGKKIIRCWKIRNTGLNIQICRD